ncbi:DUF6191 domain-containing protein [Kitasatospora purpeofusca]|uniref:DUF6191 domain-containing protein n=1 Tax=Kitasatospora purpeofusca TaxID=67352 RepID=UPI002B1D849E|nr:DUF6191 domain-containing protein [Kitasatospora purpeofusca]
MALVFAMTIPGLVCVLVALSFVDQLALRARRSRLVPWRGTGREGQISATGFEQLHAQFAAGKQHQLDERQSSLMLRDEEGEGAPPRTRVDLAGGVAVVVPPTASAPAPAPASAPAPDRASGPVPGSLGQER